MRLTIIVAIISLGAAVACNKAQVTEPLTDSGMAYVPTTAWRTADPVAAGFDGGRIAKLRSDVSGGRFGTIDGVVIVRYGHVVHEQYGANWSATKPHTLQSVSKSVTALLYGTISGRSDAQLDRKVVDIFPRYSSIANRDANKDALTVRELLMMRTSMAYWEQPYAGSPHEALNQSTGDWTKFILDRPMAGSPGATWAYNSGAAILTCSVIREITGDSIHVFARRDLFSQIGITSAYWFVSPFDALPHCGGGLNMSPPDLARIGYLVLRGGKWGEKQVVPSAWISAMTQPYSSGSPVFFPEYGSGYGYFWWLFPVTRGGTGFGVWAGSGSGGQWLFVVPSKDLVIAVTASDGNGLDLLYDVLAALK